MKKIILTLMPFFLISITSFGQLEKGTFLLGGGLGYSSSSSQTEDDVSNILELTNLAFSISPDFGYFFKSNWVLGLSLPISRFKRMSNLPGFAGIETHESSSKTTNFGIAPFVRKYISVNDFLSFFLQARLGYNHSRTELIDSIANRTTSTSTESREVIFDATAGLSYFPKKWLGINLSISPLNFSSSSSKQEFQQNSVDQESSSFSLGFDSSVIGLGVNFFLPKK
ncbi:hypothetical protein Aoki45_23500 [Algoriphagus sp. oki45]|uniref:outer membrane beta-barrel protein n=1 Tax=Algoriphagus sp. oki45 TaxID=3067294 RepID=UPI0027EDC055|nr:hypothetical protein Aoki45_23500 [Algoriphagus sp. oki45]